MFKNKNKRNFHEGRPNRLFESLFGHPRLLLAATGIRLAHPVSGQGLRLQAGLAEDFAEVIWLGWGEGAAERALAHPAFPFPLLSYTFALRPRTPRLRPP